MCLFRNKAKTNMDTVNGFVEANQNNCAVT